MPLPPALLPLSASRDSRATYFSFPRPEHWVNRPRRISAPTALRSLYEVDWLDKQQRRIEAGIEEVEHDACVCCIKLMARAAWAWLWRT